jgi:NO-binding membrane sensor protein with MHYT domain
LLSEPWALAMLNLDWHFFPVFDQLDPATAYPGTYNLGLVATSVAIAILAAFVALSISERIVAARTPRARYAWASAGAISMGGGIWSMHFIGMLAFSLPCGITYDPLGTALSMIPGMLASGIALGAISKPDEPSLSRLSVSAVLMGAGIAAMHYSGMAAMRPDALLRYNPKLVVISIGVAVVLAFVSLGIRFRFHRSRSSRMAATIAAASVMGCAVAGMHYTAMEASIFFPLPDEPTRGMALSPPLLALLITIFTVLIAVTTLVATFAGRQSELALSLSDEISRRKCTEEDLRRSEVYLAEAQRLSHTGSWAFNVATRAVVHSSEEYLRLFAFDPAAGMPVWDDWVRRIHPEDRERTMDTIEQSIREETHFELDYRTAHPDGTIKYIHAVGHPVLNASGDLVEFMGASIDMTERKRAEAEARESERRRREAQAELAHVTRATTLGELTASIAHEVNQPLAAVLANAEACLLWLNGETPDLDGARRSVEWIIQDGNRAGEVVRRVRGLLKKSDTQKAPLDVNDVVNDSIHLVQRELLTHQVSLRTELAPTLLSVLADRVQLQQVIINLMINGIQAMQPVTDRRRELTIRTHQNGAHQILVTVKDCGGGISPKTRIGCSTRSSPLNPAAWGWDSRSAVR